MKRVFVRALITVVSVFIFGLACMSDGDAKALTATITSNVEANKGTLYDCQVPSSYSQVDHTNHFGVSFSDGSTATYDCAAKCAQDPPVGTTFEVSSVCPGSISIGGYQTLSLMSCQEAPKWYLTVQPINALSGAWLSGGYTTGPHNNGSYASGNPPYTGQEFVGWRNGQSGATMYSNVTIYPMYKRRVYLRSTSVDHQTGRGLGAGQETSVLEGDYAAIGHYGYAGYQWHCWKAHPSYGCASGSDYYGTTLYNDTHVYAAFLRWKFSGLATVSTVTNDINNPSVVLAPTTINSGWGGDNGSKNAGTLNIECANEGCKVRFSFDIRRDQGNGSTGYNIYRSINGAAWQLRKGPGSTGGANVGVFDEVMTPGQTICYHMAFVPYGVVYDNSARTVQACAYAKPTTFAARTQAISASGTTNAGWASSNNAQYHNIYGCTAYGCNIRFLHHLNRTGTGIGTSLGYQISRTSNYWVSSKSLGVAPNGNLKNGNFRPSVNGTQNNTGHLMLDTGNYKLVPGMVVCETLTFRPNNTSSNTAYTRVCALALGNAQPPDPANPDTPNPNKPGGDETISPAFLNIKVKNNSVEKYNKYQTTIMAKPSDVLTFRATYNPVLQYTYELVPQKMRIDCNPPDRATGCTTFPVNSVNSAYKLAQLYNANKPAGKSNWRNGFSVSSNNFAVGSFHQDYNYTVGETALRAQTNNKTVNFQEAGKNISETAKTNMNNNTQTTPSQVNFVPISNNNVANVVTAEVTSTANVRVPINYNTRSEVLSQNEYVYPGEQTTIKYEIDILPKNNPETTNNSSEVYATTAPKVHRKLIVYKPGATSTIKPGVDQWGSSATDNLCSYFGLPNNEYDCGYTDQVIDEALNPNGNPEGYKHDNLDATFNVQDQNAGTRICVAVANYPSNSGPATNYSDYQGSHTWRISDSRCYTVAKKPNIAVWGGNVYSSGKITTFTSVKNNVAGYTAYNLRQANNESYVFGSWTDGGLVSAGVVANSTKDSSGGNVTAGFASGSGTGFATNTNGVTWPRYNSNNERIAHPNPDPGPGGSLEKAAEVSICIRSTLTFANHPCNNNIGVGSIGSSIASSNVSDDKSSIVSKLAFGGTPNVSGTVALNDASKIREGDIYYYYSGNEDVTIPISTIQNNTIQVVHSNKNVIISGNVKYPTSFTTFEEIPKLVVYGKNIVIDCGVEEIHALLVADEKVITCNNFDGDFEHLEDKARDHINDRDNANQLKITGAIVANKLIPNRTYGNGAGANSIVPAEIIDYDPTLYLWGAKQDPDDGHHEQSETLDATYIHEISPRY